MKKRHYRHLVFLGFIGMVLVTHALHDSVFMRKPVVIDAAGKHLLQDQFQLDQKFGIGGYFSQSVQHGYNLFTNTPKHASRFVGNQKSCGQCHTPKQMAYAFVSMDRFNINRGKRLSFETQIRRCYVKQLEGHMPPFFDPSLQDLKIFARFMSIGYGLQEGSLPALGTFADETPTNEH